MNFKNILFLLFLGVPLLSSCHDEIESLENEGRIQTKSAERQVPTLEYRSREDFQTAITTLIRNSESKNPLYLANDIQTLSPGESLYDQPAYEEYMIEYVPNPQFAKLLNKNGEFMVNDTIYKITPNGTYYFEKGKKNQFDRIFQQDSTLCGNLIADKLYQIAEGIYRIDTYYYKKEEASDEYQTSTLSVSNHVSYGANPNYAAFGTFGMTHENLLQFIIKNIIGDHRSFIENFTNEKRRVRGEFYQNNHGAYIEIGAKGWTDKKNWIGWSKTESNELRVGWKDVLIATKIPDHFNDSSSKLNNLVETADQYFYFPGTTYKVNTRTFAIPDLDQSTLKKQLDKGSKELFNWLKSKYGVSTTQSEWDRLQAILIVTRTHIFQIIKDEDITKFNSEYYCHVFASQVRIGIEINQNTFSKNISTLIKNLIIGIVKETTSISFPTVIGGKVHIAARFDNEWRGANLEKKNELDRLFRSSAK